MRTVVEGSGKLSVDMYSMVQSVPNVYQGRCIM